MNQQQRTPSRQGEAPPSQQGGRPEQPTRSGEELRPVEDLVEYVRVYTRQRPESVAIACFAVGFILGWRLKPW